jgi:multidrug efflux pump subunit AcrB
LGIVRFALRFPHTFYVVAALILFLGVTAAVEMPTDIFPEINIPVVSVIWQEAGLNTTEMEQRVTTYSQYAISATVNGIRDIEAETVNGISVQKIYFQPDVNVDLAISQIVAATNEIRALLPTGIQPPTVAGRPARRRRRICVASSCIRRRAACSRRASTVRFRPCASCSP